jgi:ATP-dependent RNA helicase DeaD
MSLKDFLKAVLDLGRDDVFKVEVKETFSFFSTDAEHMPKVVEFFTDFKHNGRYVNVEISTDKGRKDKSRSGKFSGKRRSSDFESQPSGNFKRGVGDKGKKTKSFGKFEGAASRPRKSRRK